MHAFDNLSTSCRIQTYVFFFIAWITQSQSRTEMKRQRCSPDSKKNYYSDSSSDSDDSDSETEEPPRSCPRMSATRTSCTNDKQVTSQLPPTIQSNHENSSSMHHAQTTNPSTFPVNNQTITGLKQFANGDQNQPVYHPSSFPLVIPRQNLDYKAVHHTFDDVKKSVLHVQHLSNMTSTYDVKQVHTFKNMLRNCQEQILARHAKGFNFLTYRVRSSILCPTPYERSDAVAFILMMLWQGGFTVRLSPTCPSSLCITWPANHPHKQPVS